MSHGRRQNIISPFSVGALIISPIILIPFLFVFFRTYNSLRKELITNSSYQIQDTGIAVRRLVNGAGIIGLILFISIYLGWGIHTNVGLAVFFTVFYAIYLTAKSFAVALVGVVLNESKNELAFPSDGILRNAHSFRDIVDSIIPSRSERVPLTGFTSNFNRQAGKTLILHGGFGTRSITFSDKTRRDELLFKLRQGKPLTDFDAAAEGSYD